MLAVLPCSSGKSSIECPGTESQNWVLFRKILCCYMMLTVSKHCRDQQIQLWKRCTQCWDRLWPGQSRVRTAKVWLNLLFWKERSPQQQPPPLKRWRMMPGRWCRLWSKWRAPISLQRSSKRSCNSPPILRVATFCAHFLADLWVPDSFTGPQLYLLFISTSWPHPLIFCWHKQFAHNWQVENLIFERAPDS